MAHRAYALLYRPFDDTPTAELGQLYFPVASARAANYAGMPQFFGGVKHEGESDWQALSRAVGQQSAGRLTLKPGGLHLVHSAADGLGQELHYYVASHWAGAPAEGPLPAGGEWQGIQAFLAGPEARDTTATVLERLRITPTLAYMESLTWVAFGKALAWAEESQHGNEGLRGANDLTEIAGAHMLGLSVNLVWASSPTDVKGRIVKLGDPGPTPVQPFDVPYSVPTNVSFLSTASAEMKHHTFSSRHKYSEYMAGEAGVEGKGWGFKGDFDASYSSLNKGEKLSIYGLVQQFVTNWTLTLNSLQGQSLDALFQADLAALPRTFTPANQQQFFNVFNKYGTHVITKVEVGGCLRYETTLDTTYNMSQEKAEANMTAEYKSVFMEVEATAHAEWERMDKSWLSERRAQLNTLGGDPSVMAAALPPHDFNTPVSYKPLVEAWTNSVKKSPSVWKTSLQSLAAIVPPEYGPALNAALNAYLDTSVQASSSLTVPYGGYFTPLDAVWNVVVDKTTVPLAHPPVKPNFSLFWVVLVDKNQQVQFNESIPTADPNDFDALVDRARAKADGKAWWACVVITTPKAYSLSAKAVGWLAECGITLPTWKGYPGWPNQITAVGNTNSRGFPGALSTVEYPQHASSVGSEIDMCLAEYPLFAERS